MSFATASVALSAAGMTASAVGAYKGAKAQKAVLNYEAAVARNNETIANYQADIALANGAMQEQAQRLKTANLKGDQRAAMGASGAVIGEGSSAEILATTDMMGERDALTIRDNAARQAWALREQGKGYAAEAAFDSASAAAINPFLSAATSLLSSGGKVAGQWYSYNKATNGGGP